MKGARAVAWGMLFAAAAGVFAADATRTPATSTGAAVPRNAPRLAFLALLQALWRQAHGATLPLPGELENRAALLATIRAHVAPQESPPPA